jgi:hypothetical protein
MTMSVNGGPGTGGSLIGILSVVLSSASREIADDLVDAFMVEKDWQDSDISKPLPQNCLC